jgi:hypothetical protein
LIERASVKKRGFRKNLKRREGFMWAKNGNGQTKKNER